MARQDNDRVERPPSRRRIVTGDQTPDSGPSARPYSPASLSDKLGSDATGQSPDRNADPLADLAPVYSVDELAPVYGATPTKPDTTGPSAPTRSTRAQPAPGRPLRPDRGPTPGTTPVSPRPAPSVESRGYGDRDDNDERDDDDAPKWPRLAILVAGLVASIGLIAYGVSGMFSRPDPTSSEVSSDENGETDSSTSSTGLDLEPVSIQGEPLELQDVSLPEGALQVHRIFDVADATVVVSTHPSNAERETVATLNRSSREWTVAPADVVLSAVGPASDGLVAIADSGGAYALAQSSDGGASWTPVDGASELPSSDLDLIARNDAGIVFAKAEVPGDNRAQASETLAAAGVELPTNMIAGVSSQTITYFEGASDETSWWLLPSYTMSWADFGLEPQAQWAAYPPEAPRTLYRWAGESIEEVPDPFGADQFLLTLDTVLGEFRATTYDATAVGFSEWRSPDGATWSAFGSVTRPPFTQAPASAIQRVSLDGIEWQIVTLPERDPVLTRRDGSTAEWTVVDAASVIDGTDLTGFKPSSLAVADRVLTLTLDGPQGQASVVAQSSDASSWKVADVAAPHIEASVASASLMVFGVDQDPSAGPPTLHAVRAS